jgi:hypothetical protein
MGEKGVGRFLLQFIKGKHMHIPDHMIANSVCDL